MSNFFFEVGLWILRQVMGGVQFNQDQKQSFIKFVEAMASRSNQSAKILTEYERQGRELDKPGPLEL